MASNASRKFDVVTARLYKVRLDDGRVFIALGAYTQQAEKAVTSRTGTKNVVTCEPIALEAYEITNYREWLSEKQREEGMLK